MSNPKKPAGSTAKPKAKPPAGAKLVNDRVVPLSEDERKFRDDWSKEQCVEELRRVAEANPDTLITRNFFRTHSAISEATWNRYFGTFAEYRRQAGIVLSRHAHRIERNVAKHASVDTLREMNIDKAGWSDAYRKPSGKRFQSILVCSDVHDERCDPFYRRLFLETAKRVQPEIIVFNGDIWDATEFGKYVTDPREWNVTRKILWVHAFLRELRDACPDAEFVFIEGNHEYRLLRHLAEATPALKVVLHDLHAIKTIPDLLKLHEFEIRYVTRSDLTAFTEADIKREVRKNWEFFHNCLVASHYPKDRQKGYAGWNGHHHSHLVWRVYNPACGIGEWHQLGAGHMRRADYCDGENWSNGFLLVHVDTERLRSQFEYIDCTHDHCLIGGTWYTRQPDEFVTTL